MIAYALRDEGDSVSALTLVELSKVIIDKDFDEITKRYGSSRLMVYTFDAPYEVITTAIYKTLGEVLDELTSYKQNAHKYEDEFKIVGIDVPVECNVNKHIATVTETIKFSDDELNRINKLFAEDIDIKED